jgi:hypothetical protein
MSGRRRAGIERKPAKAAGNPDFRTAMKFPRAIKVTI